jgi:hypothetical protein
VIRPRIRYGGSQMPGLVPSRPPGAEVALAASVWDCREHTPSGVE